MNLNYLGTLVADFSLFEEGVHDLEKCREELRLHLQHDNSNEFPYGREMNLHALMSDLLMSPSTVYSSVLSCPAGHNTHGSPTLCTTCVFTMLGTDNHASL